MTASADAPGTLLERRLDRPGRDVRSRAAILLYPTPYRIAVLVTLAVLVPMADRLPWSGDIGQHASTMWRLRTDFTHPRSPMIDVPGDGSPYFSPYQVFGALLSRITQLTPLQTLHMLAVGNVILLLAGLWAFVRALSSHRWAPVLALTAYFFLWGTDVSVWSGYESFLSLSLGISYPSTFAAGLMFLTWGSVLWLLGRAPDASAPDHSPVVSIAVHALIGLVLVAVVLSHPFTGVITLLGLSAVLLGSVRGLSARNRAMWTLSAAVLLAGVMLWPYWNLLALKQSPALDSIHRGLYDHPLDWFGFAIVLGVPALIGRFRRDRLDPLVWLFLLTAAGVLYGRVSGHYSWGRLYPGVITALQLAFAVELVGHVRKYGRRQQLTLVAATVLAAGAWVQSGALFYLVPKRHFPDFVTANVQTWNPWPGFWWTTAHLHYGDTVMTRGERPLVMLPAYGYYTVAAGYPDPAVPQSELDRRGADTTAFFAENTPNEERHRLLRKYHATWVLIRPQDGQVPTGPGFTTVAVSPQGEYLVKAVAP